MSKPSKWKKVFPRRNDPLAYVAGIVAMVVTQNALTHLLQHFLGQITPLDAVWWVLSILAIAVGWIVIAIVARFRKKA